MDSAGMANRHMLPRWALALLGWSCWFVSVFCPINVPPGKTLFTIYTDILQGYRVEILRVPLGIQVAIHLFALASMTGLASPLLMIAVHRAWLPRFRWLGWLLVGILPMMSWIIARFGPQLAFCLFTVSHLLVCAAIVRWPGEPEPAARGFEVLPAESQDDAASPK